MNIRYFKRTQYTSHDKDAYWVTLNNNAIVVWSSGDIWEARNSASYIEDTKPEINPPDPVYIEERYINATDRPSLKDKK